MFEILTRVAVLIVSAALAAPAVAHDAEDASEGPKSAVCHRPPGNPTKAKTLCIAEDAVQDHLDHGDTRGACAAADEGKGRKDRGGKRDSKPPTGACGDSSSATGSR